MPSEAQEKMETELPPDISVTRFAAARVREIAALTDLIGM